MYHIWFVYDCDKDEVVDHIEYMSRREWMWDVRRMPYDIVDSDNFNFWFDFGDS